MWLYCQPGTDDTGNSCWKVYESFPPNVKLPSRALLGEFETQQEAQWFIEELRIRRMQEAKR